MAYCDTLKLMRYWRDNPPAHVSLRVIAEGKRIKLPEKNRDQFSMDPRMFRSARANTKPLSKMPQAVAQMFKDMQAGIVPGMKRPDV